MKNVMKQFGMKIGKNKKVNIFIKNMYKTLACSKKKL